MATYLSTQTKLILSTLIPGCSLAISVRSEGDPRWVYGDAKSIGRDRVELRLWGSCELHSVAFVDMVKCVIPQVRYERRRAICQAQRAGRPPPPPVNNPTEEL